MREKKIYSLIYLRDVDGMQQKKNTIRKKTVFNHHSQCNVHATKLYHYCLPVSLLYRMIK
jgi:hypothetical protein